MEPKAADDEIKGHSPDMRDIDDIINEIEDIQLDMNEKSENVNFEANLSNRHIPPKEDQEIKIIKTEQVKVSSGEVNHGSGESTAATSSLKESQKDRKPSKKQANACCSLF